MKALGILLLTGTLTMGCSDTGTAQPRTPAKVDPRIRLQVNNQGTARVIVRLRVPINTQDKLTEQQELAQQRAIAAGQQAFLKKLANTKHRVIRQFEISPDLVLEIGPEALSLIERADEVEQIFHDELVAPSR